MIELFQHRGYYTIYHLPEKGLYLSRCQEDGYVVITGDLGRLIAALDLQDNMAEHESALPEWAFSPVAYEPLGVTTPEFAAN